jgi:hypothetical protein
MHLISVYNDNRFQMLEAFRKQGMGLDINPDQETSYTTHTLTVFEKRVENK